MTIYPAVDLLDGKCVRLKRGEVNEVTVYYDDPMEPARKWVAAGAQWLHLIDLNGAMDGGCVHLELIKQIKAELQVKVQVGGGIRDRAAVMEYLNAGIDRVILGTSVCEDEKFTRAALGAFGDQIAVSIDARDGKVATHGWKKTSGKLAIHLVKELAEWGLETLIYTDIKRDGMMQGPNLAALQIISEGFSKEVIASGGITTIEDVAAIAHLKQFGVDGMIIGRALYENTVTLAEAMDLVTG